MYAVELNGTVVAETRKPRVALGSPDDSLALMEGDNRVRVAALPSNDGEWSDPVRFVVHAEGGIRARYFDLEDDGPIELTGSAEGAAIEVSSAFGQGPGKGAQLHVAKGSRGIAYKNFRLSPPNDVWVRLSVRFETISDSKGRLSLARIRSDSTEATERLIWTGTAITSSSTADNLVLPMEQWIQLQVGVLSSGEVELWAYDGHQERIVGRGVNHQLLGQRKDLVSFGNDLTMRGGTAAVWFDNVAVGEFKLPWVQANPTPLPTRLISVSTLQLSERFSFVFGSCNASTMVPYRGFALQAAADQSPDFVVHLGDNGYSDTGAYQQSAAGYKALWSDMLYEEQLGRLSTVPWLYLASDHDLGGNNIDRTTVLPAAAEAFDAWHANPTDSHADGRYGEIELDEGRIALMWLDTISYRSPIAEVDSDAKTMLGSGQKEWFLESIARRTGGVVIIASQTTIGHASDTGWARYPAERREVLNACLASGATVRWITGDHHTPRWTRMGNVAEWGAAPFAEVPQDVPRLAEGVDAGYDGLPASVLEDIRLAGGRRAEILKNSTPEQLRLASSYGRVEVDRRRGTVRFEVRDHKGDIRIHPDGFQFAEVLPYR